MQTQQPDIPALVAQLKTRLGDQAPVSDEELGDELQKYLDYGVPADQAMRTILRHRGAPSPTAAGSPAAATPQERGVSASVNNMQTTQTTPPTSEAPTTPTNLPYLYGPLKQVYRIKPGKGVRGYAYRHAVDIKPGEPEGEVMSLVISQDGMDPMTLTHLWQPRKPHTSASGSKLRHRNLPRFKDGETFESDTFKDRQFEVYEGRNGLFVVCPRNAGILELEPVAARAQTFNPIALREALQAHAAERAAYRAANPRGKPKPGPAPAPAPAPEAKALDDQVLGIIKANEGQKGAKWDDVQQAVKLLHEAGAQPSDEQVSDAIGRLMDNGLVYEPTLGILKTP